MTQNSFCTHFDTSQAIFTSIHLADQTPELLVPLLSLTS